MSPAAGVALRIERRWLNGSRLILIGDLRRHQMIPTTWTKVTEYPPEKVGVVILPRGDKEDGNEGEKKSSGEL